MPYDEVTDGTQSAIDFNAWLNSNLEMYASSINAGSLDIRDICEVDYVYDPERNPFMDTSEFYTMWLEEFDAL